MENEVETIPDGASPISAVFLTEIGMLANMSVDTRALSSNIVVSSFRAPKKIRKIPSVELP